MKNFIALASVLSIALCAPAFSEDIVFDDSSWNIMFTLRVTTDSERYLVGGRPYTGELIQTEEYFSDDITVRDGNAVRDSSVYFTDRNSGERYCTEVKTTMDTLVTDVITYVDATYTDERNPVTGKGNSVYTEGGRVCMTTTYDSLSYHEYGKCRKQNWFDEMLE